MIVFDVLSGEASIGNKGDRMRLFLTESGYKKALENQDKAFIRSFSKGKSECNTGTLRTDRNCF